MLMAHPASMRGMVGLMNRVITVAWVWRRDGEVQKRDRQLSWTKDGSGSEMEVGRTGGGWKLADETHLVGQRGFLDPRVK